MKKEYGCGERMASGEICTNLNGMPNLCDVCQKQLIEQLETHLTKRAADAKICPHPWKDLEVHDHKYYKCTACDSFLRR